MNLIPRAIRSHPKIVLITASLLVAVTGFWLTSTRTPDVDVVSAETTYATEATGPRLGAAVYFPQGTNPPLLEELAPEVAVDGSLTIEEARWKRDEIVAFGTFESEEMRCELLLGGEVLSPTESSPVLQTAGDVFLQTFRPRYRDETSYSVRCGVPGDGFIDRRIVSGTPP